MIWDDNELEKENIPETEVEEEHTEEQADDQTEDTEAAPDTASEEGDPEEASGNEDGEEADSGDKKDGLLEELRDKIMRQMAEFDNYRKRTEKEKAQNYEIGAADFIIKLLPVVDNFERAIDAMSQEEKDSSFGQGVEMIYKQLMKVLEDENVTEIEAQGIPFDPAFHNAVMQQETEEYESGMVMQVMQKGYMYKDRVLRHSMVMVAQ